jgi:RNA polymerase sigma-70 factor (ECF subfamily)
MSRFEHRTRSRSWQSDQDLARGAAAGDRGAARTIAERLFERVRTSVTILAGEDRDADDLVQLSLLEILRSTRTFGGRSSLETWADRITIRTCMSQLRKRNRKVLPFDRTEPRDQSPDADPNGCLVRKRLSERLVYQLSRLPIKQRTAVMLRLVYDYDIADIAETTGASSFAVKGRLRLGLRRLRKAARFDPELREWGRKHMP